MSAARRIFPSPPLLLLLLPVFLQGCGFQLRGTPELPAEMKNTHVQAEDRYTPFYRELTTTLRRSGVGLVDDPSEAGAIIRIHSDETGRRLLTVTARNVPAEYEVYYRVRFSADFGGQEVIAPEQLALTRDFAFDETRVLGKAAEEELLRRAIAADLVGLVTRRLAAVH